MAAALLRLIAALALSTADATTLRQPATQKGAVAAAEKLEPSATPVSKVIQLLKGLEKQVEEDGAKEAAEYDKFACFCKEQADQKLYMIEKSDEKIKALTASIDELDAEITLLSTEISELADRIEVLKTDIGTEVESRAKEHATYKENDEELASAIATVDYALKVLRSSRDKVKETSLAEVAGVLHRPGVAAMLSVVAGGSGLSDGARQAGLRLARGVQPGTPSSYEYHSKDVIELLMEIRDVFSKTKKEFFDSEMEKKSISDKKVLAMTNEQKFKEQDKAEKSELYESKSAEKHDLEGQRDEETKARDADTEFQAVLTEQCQERATEWDQRSTSRAAELSAISEAIGILESGAAVKYSANKKLVDLHQVHPALRARASSAAPKDTRRASVTPMLLQLGQVGQASAAPRTQAAAAQLAVAHLGAAAQRIGSAVLAAVAMKASVKDAPVDHFVKVRGIIEDLIARLEAEAADEATQKSFCDKEISAAVQSRDEQQSEVETQSATISKNEAQIALLKKEIATLSEEIAELNKALLEATELRGVESANNAKTIADATEGKASVDEAIEILKEYYKLEGGAAMLQKGKKYVPPDSDRDGSTVGDLAPEMSYSGEYKGKTDAAGGVIGLLQVIQADFERTIDVVTTAEGDAVTKFGEFKTQTDTDISTKQGEKETKEGEITTAEETITTAADAKRDAETSHASAIEELDKLKAMCVEGAESYEERAKKREQEVEALKEALNILENFNK